MNRIHKAAVCTVLAISIAGCSRSLMEAPVQTSYDRASVTDSVDFWHQLPSRAAVTNGEAMHALLLFADSRDPHETYDERIADLLSRGWLAEGFDEPADLAMQRGTLAKGLAGAMDIGGGVMMRLTDRSPRYSTRELLFLGIFPPGTSQQVLNGYQFIGVISKAQDYQLLREGMRIREVPPSAEELDAASGDTPEAESAASEN